MYTHICMYTNATKTSEKLCIHKDYEYYDQLEINVLFSLVACSIPKLERTQKNVGGEGTNLSPTLYIYVHHISIFLKKK